MSEQIAPLASEVKRFPVVANQPATSASQPATSGSNSQRIGREPNSPAKVQPKAGARAVAGKGSTIVEG